MRFWVCAGMCGCVRAYLHLLTRHLSGGMEDVYIHGSVDSGVNQSFVSSSKLVCSHYTLLLPVCPVEPVLEHSYGEDVLDVGAS